MNCLTHTPITTSGQFISPTVLALKFYIVASECNDPQYPQ